VRNSRRLKASWSEAYAASGQERYITTRLSSAILFSGCHGNGERKWRDWKILIIFSVPHLAILSNQNDNKMKIIES
jgi:hypothetical protein